MPMQTKYFGEINYDPTDILHFPKGLFGFEEETQFLLLPFGDSAATLLCLQSVSTAGLAFVVMNPFSLQPEYAPVLQKEELKAMGVSVSQELCYYVLCVVKDPIAESTVNLKCPVVINEDSKQAMQVILESTDYEMRHQLSEFAAGKADASC